MNFHVGGNGGKGSDIVSSNTNFTPGPGAYNATAGFD